MITQTKGTFHIPAKVDYDTDTGKIIAIAPDWEELHKRRVRIETRDGVQDEALVVP